MPNTNTSSTVTSHQPSEILVFERLSLYHTIHVAPGFNILKGTVMGKVTQNGAPNFGLYIPYIHTATDGSQIPRGFLVEFVNTIGQTVPQTNCAMYIKGYLYSNGFTTPNLPGLDANACTVAGWRYDAVMGWVDMFTT